MHGVNSGIGCSTPGDCALTSLWRPADKRLSESINGDSLIGGPQSERNWPDSFLRIVVSRPGHPEK